MTIHRGNFPAEPLTIGDLLHEASFAAYSRRQIEYALERGRIRSLCRVGIIRIYSVDQLPQILEALRRTTGRGRRRKGVQVHPILRDRAGD